ncbi:HPP family protein [Salinarimonas rosea]|uniref:HPP family protein n=1 Tax=Salinarimonas rosea TaxID=552063 RepID=UPI000415893C|nr:HPP family protein [Salinarimonas rosea]
MSGGLRPRLPGELWKRMRLVVRKPSTLAVRFVLAGIATAIAVGLLELAALTTRTPYWQVPFVTSIALVIGLPYAEASTRRALIGGHIVAALVGYAVLYALGPSIHTAAFACGLAVTAMLATRTMHPPAAVNPFLVVNESLGLGFLVGTIVPGAILLAVFAFVWNEVITARWTRRG